MSRTLATAALIALVIGFGSGFLTAKSFGHRAGSNAVAATNDLGDLWSLFGKPRAADAPRRGEPMPYGFAIWKTRLDTSGQQPLGCVRLTRPLDPAKSYSDFVLISPQPDHPPAVVPHGDELCIGGVDFTDHKVTLLHGLPDKAGETLAQDSDVDFTLGDKPPYVGFAGDGVILPRDESDGVGIETINVRQLYVEVWRVPDRNLVRKSISAPPPTPEGEYGDDWEASPDDEGRIVWKGTVAVRGPLAAKSVTVFPLGAVLKEMTPGGYVIKAKDASAGRDPNDDTAQPARAMRWVIYTDMALTAYKGATALDVVVRSLKTAKTSRRDSSRPDGERRRDPRERSGRRFRARRVPGRASGRPKRQRGQNGHGLRAKRRFGGSRSGSIPARSIPASKRAARRGWSLGWAQGPDRDRRISLCR